ncbi:Sapep family Mn(2+)-dependent dipeptidase [Maledivibacter halophilus]|uniref:Dipeptidase, putative n=1 Tax=Maledivibacter halophilus TaxID=36842 RepID=A0A1T5MPY2_9FIRM|nr:Sapep family Mn(2+)-dependent dipeptidase [Maledivibacter halophilus]SKC90084.1 dipeptidase, putative [Maledivibacter halophilus]
MDTGKILEKLHSYRGDIKRDLSQLIEINSKRDLTTKKVGAPFGLGIRKCFNKMIEFAKREGFTVRDFDGYAMHIEYGYGEEVLGILGHLDIVGIQEEDKWNSKPFELIEKNGFWYGRGINDNKGPMLGCLYLLKILKELGYKPNKKIRLILGGAEETTWECMSHYFRYNKMPIYGFSPDGDFPIVNCEKGISYYNYQGLRKATNDGIYNIVSIKAKEDITKVCSEVEIYVQTHYPEKLLEILSDNIDNYIDDNGVKIVYRGISAMGRNPHRGENAIFKFVKDFKTIDGLDKRAKELIDFLNGYFVDSIHGEKLGLYYNDEETGITTNNLSYVLLNDETCIISFDYRYGKGVEYEKVINRLKEIGIKNKLELITIKEMPLLYVSSDSILICALKKAYHNITKEEAQLFSKGAASYARTLEQGVAFGPTFSTHRANSHKPNENINLKDFEKALLIYAEAIKLLS